METDDGSLPGTQDTQESLDSPRTALDDVSQDSLRTAIANDSVDSLHTANGDTSSSSSLGYVLAKQRFVVENVVQQLWAYDIHTSLRESSLIEQNVEVLISYYKFALNSMLIQEKVCRYD
ncbi:hypothetical protein Y032_0631g857 [Ancylostoma ceylanicum]|uniref:Uncharacterized protein n=1 Tax=Ancylostoma ceylanicum TaxID=53326 RepID=A0A016WKB5_9BILA|nr:hypothetical protein Y032_0631g857 [Ancylostoma ceylanicum]